MPPLQLYSHGVLVFGRPRLHDDHADQFVGLVAWQGPVHRRSTISLYMAIIWQSWSDNSAMLRRRRPDL